jgi:hypothetical protein
MTGAKVRLELAQDEAQELQKGNDLSLHAEISPSILISMGLELEDQQYGIASQSFMHHLLMHMLGAD